MENEMMTKNPNKSLVVLIVILIVLVLGLGGYLVYDKVLSQDKQNDAGQEQKEETLSKVDSTKDWVYDAIYDGENLPASYTTVSGDTYYLSDIKVPYININNEVARKANEEIKKIYDQAILTYKDGVEDKVHFVECTYSKVVYNNVLSVVVKPAHGGTAVLRPKYYTYNFDLTTGKLLTYQEVYEKLGFTPSTINDRARTAITSVMREILKNHTPDNYMPGTNFDTYNNNTYNRYVEDANNNKIRYFIDSNNKLNIATILVIPDEIGYSDILVPIN